jgi:hypothetical protein
MLQKRASVQCPYYYPESMFLTPESSFTTENSDATTGYFDGTIFQLLKAQRLVQAISDRKNRCPSTGSSDAYAEKCPTALNG